MSTKNTRNARLLYSLTDGAGTGYTAVNKSHGLKVNTPTDFSEDTGHGQLFKSYIPGLHDFGVELTRWYDSANHILIQSSLQEIPYYWLAYPDFSDSQNYWKFQGYIGHEGDNYDLGNTVDGSYKLVPTGSDPVWVANGTAIVP